MANNVNRKVVPTASNSNHRFHLAGPRGLFLKAANAYFILLNGSVALKCVIGQPQMRDSVVPLISGIATFRKRPHGPELARHKGHNENFCKIIRFPKTAIERGGR